MTNFLSRLVQSVPPSGIRRFFDIAATMDDVISLSVGEPDFITPTGIRQAAIKAIEAGQTKYTSNAGILELRKAICDNLRSRYGVNYDADDEINVTVGVSEGLSLAMMATMDPGDEVIVPEPCFVSYKPAVMFAGGVPVPVATSAADGFQIDPEAIRRAITPRTKGLLIGFPSNPTGATMERSRFEAIAKICDEHNLLVFSDEIYDRLIYGGTRHVCFASLPGMRERTVTLNGFSKSHAMTGWRIGYTAAPKEISLAIRKLHQYVIMSAPSMGQAAAIEALTNAEADVVEMVRQYDERRRVIVDGLNAAGLNTFEPKGAFYAFPDIRSTGLSSEEFCEKLLMEQHVAVVPGSAFGECGEGYVRISYAASMENIREALSRIHKFVEARVPAKVGT